MKRKASEAVLLREAFLKQIKLDQDVETARVLFFQRHSTKLILPDNELIPEDFRTLFAYRSYRTLISRHIKTISDIDIPTALDYLAALSERYKSKLPNMPSPRPHTGIGSSRKQQGLELATRYLLKNAYTYHEIAVYCGLKKSQVQALEKRLKTHGNVRPSKTHRLKVLNWMHLQNIHSQLGNSNAGELTLSSIKTNLLERFDEIPSISLPTLANEMHLEGFSYKKVTSYVANRNYTSTKQLRIQVSLKLVAALYLDHTVIFVDETSVQLGMSLEYGWGLKGEKLLLKKPPRRDSYSVLTAITDNEVLGCILLQGGMTQDDYCGFICTLIRSIDRLQRADSLVIFADNLRAHKTDLIHQVLGERVTLLFNAAYSPMLNPIETFFAKFKKLIRSQVCHTEKQLLIAVQVSMRKITPENFNGYMRNTINYIYRSLDEQDV